MAEANGLKTLKAYLSGEDYVPSNTEEEPPYSKLIYLIIHLDIHQIQVLILKMVFGQLMELMN